ncbi:hypothetical protein MHB43_10415 [Paenibacillus sp. FSL H8-0317]|uniref:hypothetical protein n=1 Tax=Paenibacillus sp. FSL H8-0317 TaxID=2921385 RepID=UPI0032517E6A
MRVGMRIIYDQDGEIVFNSGEMSGDVLPRKEVTKIEHIDLDYGVINFLTHRIVRIDIETKQPILEEIPIVLSPEEQRIKELEDQVLLLANENTGGIL